jgi:predicted kinase
MPTLYLLRGLPGSGKSTLAKNMLDAGMVRAICEADSFFMKDGEYKFDPQLLSQAQGRCQHQAAYLLSCGMSVVVSNTSTTEKEVQTYKDIADTLDCTFVSIVVENRHGSDNIHNVPAEAILRMKQRFYIKL